MRCIVFRRLHDSLVNDYDLIASRGVSTKEVLAMFLWACGEPQSFRQLRNKFGYSLETISHKFSEVLEALFRMSNDVIRPKDP
jgi:predicted chitinase